MTRDTADLEAQSQRLHVPSSPTAPASPSTDITPYQKRLILTLLVFVYMLISWLAYFEFKENVWLVLIAWALLLFCGIGLAEVWVGELPGSISDSR